MGYAWRAALVGLLFGLFAAGAAAQEFSVTDVTAAEDTAAVTFTVTLTGASGTYSYSVDYATADGTATTADSDYTADSATLSLMPCRNLRSPFMRLSDWVSSTPPSRR
ncbi:MAG: Calx-beta domain-containing protein [Candidatus Poribacteria bacterium]